jgi:hypothetical protein
MVSGYSIVEARLTDPNATPHVTREALLAMARYRRTPAMLRLIVPHASSLDVETRWRVPSTHLPAATPIPGPYRTCSAS